MLLDTLYKIYTRLIANRLSIAVEPYLRSTQFGFRKRLSTTHAIHVVRRTIEAFFHKSEPGNDLNLLLLDWSKAFDRVDTMALTDALIAFGIGGTFLKAIKSTYNKSEFRVLGQRGDPASSLYTQEVGIRQGCPLSPLLFIIMLTWLMAGVDLTLAERGFAVDPLLPSDSVFYADDIIY